MLILNEMLALFRLKIAHFHAHSLCVLCGNQNLNTERPISVTSVLKP